MRAVLLEVPEVLIAERARLGIDVFDEMWEGELHLVPPPKEEHQRLGGALYLAVAPLAEAAGLLMRYETGVFDPEVVDGSSYRTPDLVVFAPEHRSERGVEGRAALIVEIQSPGDESLAKLDFYERVGVAEVLMIHRDAKAVRWWHRAGTALVEASPAGGGGVTVACLPVTVAEAGGRLRVDTPGSSQTL